MAVPYVIGVDLGGSLTRAIVVDTHGRRVGAGTAGGGNPVSRGPDEAVESLTVALRGALDGLPAGRVGHAVLGLAGMSTFGAAIDAAVDEVWAAVGLTCPHMLRPDAEVAFAAGTSRSDGFVVVAGTGAIAAHMRDGRVARTVDGHGWLLGDRGSGFWLGREAVVAAIAAHDHLGPPTPLRAAVPVALDLPPNAPSTDIARAVYRRPPIALAALAPLVTEAAEGGDQVAADILERAAAALLRSLRTVVGLAGSPAGLPVVMGGGVIHAYRPLREVLWHGVEDLGLTPHTARSHVVGAAALAIRALTAAPLTARTRDLLLSPPAA